VIPSGIQYWKRSRPIYRAMRGRLENGKFP
jgi:hypothetical protein